MNLLEAVEQRRQQETDLGLGQLAAPLQDRRQALPFDVFLDEVGGAVLLDQAENARDIRVLDRGERFGFLAQPRQSPVEIGPVGSAQRPYRVAVGPARGEAGRHVFAQHDVALLTLRRAGRSGEIRQAESPAAEQRENPHPAHGMAEGQRAARLRLRRADRRVRHGRAAHPVRWRRRRHTSLLGCAIAPSSLP